MAEVKFKKIRRYKNLSKPVLYLSARDYNDAGNTRDISYQDLLNLNVGDKISVSSGGSHRDCRIQHSIECFYQDCNIKLFKTTGIYVGSYPTFPKYEKNNYYWIDLTAEGV